MKSKLETILIVDYGSQYTQLIARRIRELEVFCLVYPFNKITKKILNYDFIIHFENCTFLRTLF